MFRLQKDPNTRVTIANCLRNLSLAILETSLKTWFLGSSHQSYFCLRKKILFSGYFILIWVILRCWSRFCLPQQTIQPHPHFATSISHLYTTVTKMHFCSKARRNATKHSSFWNKNLGKACEIQYHSNAANSDLTARDPLKENQSKGNQLSLLLLLPLVWGIIWGSTGLSLPSTHTSLCMGYRKKVSKRVMGDWILQKKSWAFPWWWKGQWVHLREDWKCSLSAF